MRRLLALLVVISLAPSSTSAAERADAPAPDAPWTRVEGAHAAAPSAELREGSASRKAEVREVLRLRRQQLMAPATRGGSGLRGIPLDIEQATTDDADSIVRFPILAADVAGDARDEVVTLEFDLLSYGDWTDLLVSDYEATLVVRDGESGETVSSTLSSLSSLFTTADVDGDGKDEIIQLRDRVVGAGAGALLAGGAVLSVTQTVSAISGATGEELWSQTYEGTIAYALGFALVAIALVEGVANLVDQVTVTSDTSGDGKVDVFVGTFDLAIVLAFAPFVFEVLEPVRYVGHSVAGNTGREVATIAETGVLQLGCALTCVVVDALPYIIPLGDVSGDQISDVVVFSGVRDAMEARSIDGEATYWSGDRIYPFGAQIVELNGSGPADILSYDGASDGASGDPLFVPEGWDIFVVGDANDDGGNDVVEISYEWDPESETSLVSLRARAGANGSTLWTQALATPEVEPGQSSYVYLCYCSADLNGSGVSDLLAATEIIDENWDVVELSVRAIEGAEGTTIFNAVGLTNYTDLPVPFGDHNGNGTIDLITAPYVADRGFPTLRVAEGSTNAPLFSADLDAVGYVYIEYLVTGDLTASGGDEIAVGVYDEVPESYFPSLTVQVFDGPVLRWKK